MFNVGDIEVLRVEESQGHGFAPTVLLPDCNARDIEPHPHPSCDRLVPGALP
jgi:hypothetical protein